MFAWSSLSSDVFARSLSRIPHAPRGQREFVRGSCDKFQGSRFNNNKTHSGAVGIVRGRPVTGDVEVGQPWLINKEQKKRQEGNGKDKVHVLAECMCVYMYGVGWPSDGELDRPAVHSL